MAKDDGIKTLKQKLSSDNLCGIYLFTGEEVYSRKAAACNIKKKFEENGFEEFNIQTFEGKGISAEALRDTIDSFPVMAESKLIIIKNSDIFKSASEDMKKLWQEVLENPPEYLAVVFDEDNIDGRSSLAKKIKSGGIYVEFNYKSQAELAEWSGKMFAKAGISVSGDVLSHFIFSCDEGMTAIKNEVDKLISYCSVKKTVEIADIDFVVKKSLQSRIFEMLDAIVERRQDAAYRMLYELKIYKESPVKIIALIGRQANMLLKTALLLQANRYNDIAQEIGVRPFVVRKYVDQCRNIPAHNIGNIIAQCVKCDYSIKSGQMDEWPAVEMLIAGLLTS